MEAESCPFFKDSSASWHCLFWLDIGTLAEQDERTFPCLRWKTVKEQDGRPVNEIV
jgi:hypothetical protein